jgi:hypothetical protein
MNKLDTVVNSNDYQEQLDAMYKDWVESMGMTTSHNSPITFWDDVNEKDVQITALSMYSKELYLHNLTGNHRKALICRLAHNMTRIELCQAGNIAVSTIAELAGKRAYKASSDEYNLLIAGALSSSNLDDALFTVAGCRSTQQVIDKIRYVAEVLEMAIRFSLYKAWRDMVAADNLAQNPVVLDERNMSIKEVIIAIEGDKLIELTVLRARNLINLASRMLNKGDETADWCKVIKHCAEYL